MPSPTYGLPDRGSRRPLSIIDDVNSSIALELSSDAPELPELDPQVLALLIGHLVDQLNEPWRSAVTMTQLRGLTYEEAAELLEPELGRRVDRKTVWRWAHYGLDQLREWLEDTPWVSVLMRGRVPLPEGVVRLGSAVPASLDDALSVDDESEGE